MEIPTPRMARISILAAVLTRIVKRALDHRPSIINPMTGYKSDDRIINPMTDDESDPMMIMMMMIQNDDDDKSDDDDLKIINR